MTRAGTRSCVACGVRKGLIFLMLCNANRQDRAVFIMWSLKVSWSSKITPRFLTELDGVIVEVSNWMMKLCCRVGEAQLLPGWAVGDILSFTPRCPARHLCSYRWIIWSKWEIELCVISIAMVWETIWWDPVMQCMWRRGGVQEPIPGNPSDQADVLWIPPLPRPPWKTDHWDRIQTSEVESQWCPVMRGWTGGSDDWQCQKRQTDPTEWELMIWNQLLQFAGLQWLRVAQSQFNVHVWILIG